MALQDANEYMVLFDVTWQLPYYAILVSEELVGDSCSRPQALVFSLSTTACCRLKDDPSSHSVA